MNKVFLYFGLLKLLLISHGLLFVKKNSSHGFFTFTADLWTLFVVQIKFFLDLFLNQFSLFTFLSVDLKQLIKPEHG